MKLSAAVCNLSSYTVSDGWRAGGGGGGQMKYMAQHIFGELCASGHHFQFLTVHEY